MINLTLPLASVCLHRASASSSHSLIEFKAIQGYEMKLNFRKTFLHMLLRSALSKLIVWYFLLQTQALTILHNQGYPLMLWTVSFANKRDTFRHDKDLLLTRKKSESKV